MARPELNQLCLQCGLCCNGVIFAKGEVHARDDARKLRELGLKLGRATAAGAQKFHQPCSMLEGCRCRIYAARPDYCRRFECLLFKDVKAGTVTVEIAQRTIRKTFRRVGRVRGLLERLGDARNDLPLSVRFRNVSRQLERAEHTPGQAAVFGELTLAMHDLNVLLGDKFFPGGE